MQDKILETLKRMQALEEAIKRLEQEYDNGSQPGLQPGSEGSNPSSCTTVDLREMKRVVVGPMWSPDEATYYNQAIDDIIKQHKGKVIG